jgi:SAM-dependent methyltransferase
MDAYDHIKVAGGDTAQPIAMEKRLRIIRQIAEKKRARFLDCGCGAGEYVFALTKSEGFDAFGIEFDETKARKAQTHPLYGSRVRQGDLERLTFPDSHFDYALLNEVLEHVPDERRALKEIFRVLSPGGSLFVFSPNRWFPFETHGIAWKNGGKKIPHWVPFIPYVPLELGSKCFSYWARNYWPGEISALLRDAGFVVVRRDFIWLTFENISNRQPKIVAFLRPLLRLIANCCEHVPLVKRLGVSSVFVAQKPAKR